MTPGARAAAAINILDDWIAGQPAEQALTRWARQSRFAGSKDRAAVRDLFFDVLRMLHTARAFGGAEDGRALVIGMMRARNMPLQDMFTGQGYAPAPLSATEKAHAPPVDTTEIWNLPEWVHPLWKDSLGPKAAVAARALDGRAPVTVRVNASKASLEDVRRSLDAQGITTLLNAVSALALTVTSGARRLRNCDAFMSGEIEIQDASSQAVVALLPAGKACLDFCAGGGGKALALAAQSDRTVFAHDKNPQRMKDLPQRAERADCHIRVLSASDVEAHAPYDLVLCDVPCSGSGAWRRTPDAKWAFTAEKLQALHRTQSEILNAAAQITKPGGVLAYATCSVLKSENEEAIAAFIKAHPTWSCTFQQRFDIDASGDGFFTAHLTQV